MLILQDAVWNRVTINRAAKKTTWFYIDEFHLLLKEEQTAAYSIEIWKRFRKWGGIPTGITQNVKDLLSSREIENIFEKLCCKGWMSNPPLLQYGSLLIRSSLGQDSRLEVMSEKCTVQSATFALYSLDATGEGNISPTHCKRSQTAEGRENETNNLHGIRRLFVAGHPTERPARRDAVRQIRTETEGVPERTSLDSLRHIAVVGKAIPTPARDRGRGSAPIEGNRRSRASGGNHQRTCIRITTA
jgi:hypothetical protein